ncbi:MAG: bifunctional rhamnulose-1-phosphate aldolase/short-chain dehydrogenase [Chloroflexi bacterium]|nr:bifunctional rhamnulose-1-phosphate aldolase/short-chain dehydrogenase [Chloroflexota bacterium]
MQSRWSDDDARGLDPIGLRVYTSRLIGAEPALVLHGGGNTSVKLDDHDHRGRSCRSLAIKGSGSDLRTIEPGDFARLHLDDLHALRPRCEMSDDEMLAYLARSSLDPAAPRPSIETLLHAFLPDAWVDHSHADAVLALTNQPDGHRLVREVYGDRVAVVPYILPGFKLAQLTADVYDANPGVEGLVLDMHGLVTFGASARESYERHIELVALAEDSVRPHLPARGSAPGDEAAAAKLAPALRGALSAKRRVIVRYDGSPRVRAFVDRPDLEQISQQGPVTPDHVLRTKRLPLVLRATDSEGVRDAVTGYRAAYERYAREHGGAEAFQHDSAPRVVLVPGVGMFTTGASWDEAGMVADMYRHTMEVIEAASAIGTYHALPANDLYDMEYWPLELYKLTRAPAERELARRMALVTGAGSGIGRAIAQALAADGAYVFVTDVDLEAANAVAEAITAEGDRARALPLDVTSERETAQAFAAAATHAGGMDIVISNAGIAAAAPLDDLELDTWQRSLDVNATGHFLVCRAALRQMRAQGLGGSIVLICTKNALDPGAGFGAYSAAKAAQLQLGRVLAVEGGPDGIRVNMVNPDAVFEGSGLWDADLRAGRAAAHGVDVEDLEAFYAQRNLLGRRVTGPDVAEAVSFLASDRSAKTTGAVIPVDGGLRGAFPR